MSLFTSPQAARLAQSGVSLAIFFRLATSPPVRLWSGKGDFAVPTTDAIETAGNIYRGAGQLVGLPAVSALINGQAERVQFSLSGFDATAFAMADSEASTVRNTIVRLAVLPLDADLQPIGGLVWLWTGIADTPELDRQGGAAITRIVKLSVGSLFTGRRRASQSFWTAADQHRRSADDRFCDRTPAYTFTTPKSWPRF